MGMLLEKGPGGESEGRKREWKFLDLVVNRYAGLDRLRREVPATFTL